MGVCRCLSGWNRRLKTSAISPRLSTGGNRHGLPLHNVRHNSMGFMITLRPCGCKSELCARQSEFSVTVPYSFPITVLSRRGTNRPKWVGFGIFWLIYSRFFSLMVWHRPYLSYFPAFHKKWKRPHRPAHIGTRSGSWLSAFEQTVQSFSIWWARDDIYDRNQDRCSRKKSHFRRIRKNAEIKAYKS